MCRMRVSALAVLSLTAAVVVARAQEPAPAASGEYKLVVEGFDWGAGVSKVILSLDEKVDKVAAGDFGVAVKRHTECRELPTELAAGERLVVDAYVSDGRGQKLDEGSHATLVLGVAPQWPVSSPLQYVQNDKCRGNQWVDYDLTVENRKTGRVWSKGTGRISPLVDRFDVSGKFV